MNFVRLFESLKEFSTSVGDIRVISVKEEDLGSPEERSKFPFSDGEVVLVTKDMGAQGPFGIEHTVVNEKGKKGLVTDAHLDVVEDDGKSFEKNASVISSTLESFGSLKGSGDDDVFFDDVMFDVTILLRKGCPNLAEKVLAAAGYKTNGTKNAKKALEAALSAMKK